MQKFGCDGVAVARHALPDAVDAPGEAAGVAGNARLTDTTGMLLAVLLVVEGFTILNVRGYITLHTAVGLALLGPVALKCASTIYRFARYYSGHTAYVRKWPPHVLLRVIGPLVVVSTLAVLVTGIALLADHGRSGTWVGLHKASFIVWIALMGLHFLGHLQEAAVGTARDLRRNARDPATRGKAPRWLTVGVALLVGVGLAAGLTPSASTWHIHRHDHGVQRDH